LNERYDLDPKTVMKWKKRNFVGTEAETLAGAAVK